MGVGGLQVGRGMRVLGIGNTANCLSQGVGRIRALGGMRVGRGCWGRRDVGAGKPSSCMRRMIVLVVDGRSRVSAVSSSGSSVKRV